MSSYVKFVYNFSKLFRINIDADESNTPEINLLSAIKIQAIKDLFESDLIIRYSAYKFLKDIPSGERILQLYKKYYPELENELKNFVNEISREEK